MVREERQRWVTGKGCESQWGGGDETSRIDRGGGVTKKIPTAD